VCVRLASLSSQIWEHKSERFAPSFKALQISSPAEEASMSQRLCWRCYAANRAADARPGRPRAH